MNTMIVDKAGRRIALRRIGVLETLRLYKAVGPELSINSAYMSAASIASAAAMIDDVPLPFPVNEAGVELLIERLGDDGITAIADAMTAPAHGMVIAEAGN
ncbi:MAG: hypothetical protein B7Z75_03980 [Acidocella sp. 20-57-95]|nr:MAG: hypothetical protein B7Z75_03980 [Acidocella sp. 20-57-95]HQT63912.1 hypothetical protein [Acidocella sp.]